MYVVKKNKNGKWIVIEKGKKRAKKAFDNKEQAILFAKKIADDNNTSFVVEQDKQHIRSKLFLIALLAIIILSVLLLNHFGVIDLTLLGSQDSPTQETMPEEPNAPEGEIVDNIIYDDFQIHFLELGNEYSGDSTYIKVGNIDILIDAGSRKNSAATIKKYIDQYCTDNKLEYVIATHGDQDHIAGFVGEGSPKTGILYQYKIGCIIDSPLTNKNTTIYSDYVYARQTAVKNGAAHYTADKCFNQESTAERVYQLSKDVTMEILYNYYYFNSTSDENDYSVCTLFRYKEHSFMFTGDLEKSGEEKMAEYYDGSTPEKTLPKVDLFKAGHHGSKTSSNNCLLEKIQPEIVCVCCCGGGSEYTSDYKNTFPTQDMIDRVAAYTDRVYVTSIYNERELKFESLNGNIIISCNGKNTGVSATNNIIKLKDSSWFNETVYVKSGQYICSGATKKDYYTAETVGVTAVPRRIWPSS